MKNLNQQKAQNTVKIHLDLLNEFRWDIQLFFVMDS
ncbi:hypothetical protein P872_20035 [Rhodonellum psychrophilum GCM71 = DSM 17998]|uniref:Uncharacterized protein n=1 Tax=Rhodonellum psychrophilum GCM71 = DSM 17998 TaxID=1123057 RepID=U5BUM3_9BACT|nr:hypothetical protein P872_20035 [Rhodonellum psychrophilum GCM71 = DSM 17998]